MRYLLIFLLLMPFTAPAQNNCTKAPVETFIVKASPGEETIKRDKEHMPVKLVGDFDDSCLIYINDVLIFGYFVSTNPLLGQSGYTISLNKKTNKKGSVLKMLLWNKKICFAEKVSFKYPLLEIRFFDGKWKLTYTDRKAQLE